MKDREEKESVKDWETETTDKEEIELLMKYTVLSCFRAIFLLCVCPGGVLVTLNRGPSYRSKGVDRGHRIEALKTLNSSSKKWGMAHLTFFPSPLAPQKSSPFFLSFHFTSVTSGDGPTSSSFLRVKCCLTAKPKA